MDGSYHTLVYRLDPRLPARVYLVPRFLMPVPVAVLTGYSCAGGFLVGLRALRTRLIT